jgi:multiple sugar transport system permease protein
MTRRERLRNNLAGYTFIGPWLIGFWVFTIIPIVASFFISFTEYDLINPPQWIGTGNFERLFTADPRYIQAIKVTFLYVITAVPLRLVFALFVAMILVRRHRMIGFYRLVYYLPSIIGSSVAIAVVWREFFGYHGPINDIAGWFVKLARNISLVGNPRTALVTIISLYVWQFGSSMLIFLAGLKNIPDSLYESAVIDGAGGLSKFFYITLPLLTPVVLFNLVMQTIHGFMVFTQALIITDGGPMDSTLVYVLYMYRRAFKFYDMGSASAMAWLLFVVMAVVTSLIFRSSRYWVHYEAGEGK